jgi:hypothetical protein
MELVAPSESWGLAFAGGWRCSVTDCISFILAVQEFPPQGQTGESSAELAGGDLKVPSAALGARAQEGNKTEDRRAGLRAVHPAGRSGGQGQ